MSKKIKFSYSWVLVDELMVGSAPLDISNFIELKKEGIKSVLSLCSAKEVKIPDEINNFFVCESFVLPDHTYKREPQTDEIIKILQILEELTNKGPVYVHCFAGVERSPLVCMAWLVKKYSMSVNEALIYLMKVHKKTNPLPKQITCLKKLFKI